MEKILPAMVVQNLTVAYDKNTVLTDINLEIPTGKLVAVVGPNGAGKTTLIKAILSLIKPITGLVNFPILGSGKTFTQIAYVPQIETVDWDFPATVLDVVMMGRYGHLGWFKRAGKRERELALDKLELVGMQDLASRQIQKLSGGQQQRVFLARALVQEATIYFLDEPLKGVDAKTQAVILTLLQKLKQEGKTVIVVHHDLHTVDKFDWVAMVNTSLVTIGEVDTVFTQENINKTYGNFSINSAI